MSQSEKAAFYAALKEAGVEFDRHYREYSTEELQRAYEKLTGMPHPPPAAPPPPDEQAAAFFGQSVDARVAPVAPPVRRADPNEMAGQRQNSQPEDEPIRTDENGRVWLQEEVLKPAFAKARGRRVLTYQDPGAVQQTVKAGEFQETFEVPGDMANARPAQVKITLPSYQVGIYRDPRFPFKVITYNSNEGFDLDDVRKFYGGAELVPEEIKRKYVENVLCYDIRTTVRAIEDEARHIQLTTNRA